MTTVQSRYEIDQEIRDRRYADEKASAAIQRARKSAEADNTYTNHMDDLDARRDAYLATLPPTRDAIAEGEQALLGMAAKLVISAVSPVPLSFGGPSFGSVIKGAQITEVMADMARSVTGAIDGFRPTPTPFRIPTSTLGHRG